MTINPWYQSNHELYLSGAQQVVPHLQASLKNCTQIHHNYGMQKTINLYCYNKKSISPRTISFLWETKQTLIPQECLGVANQWWHTLPHNWWQSLQIGRGLDLTRAIKQTYAAAETQSADTKKRDHTTRYQHITHISMTHQERLIPSIFYQSIT